jgi:dCMP deaminase
MKSDGFYTQFMHLVAGNSDDPSTKVGAVIVNNEGRILSTGFNQFPAGTDFSWNKDGDWLQTKYPYVIHAESNAIFNLGETDVPQRMYVSLYPCNECAKLIIQAGIKEVVYEEKAYADQDFIIAAERLLDTAGIQTWKIG